jgi:hypothetical protein
MDAAVNTVRTGVAQRDPASLSDKALADCLSGPLARCAVGDADPDAWFPVAIEPQRARCQAAAALALCEKCALRAECLEVSMRQWDTIGRHGIWGGFVAAERASLRIACCDGTPATALVRLPSASTCRGSSSRLQTEQRSAPALSTLHVNGSVQAGLSRPTRLIAFRSLDEWSATLCAPPSAHER